VLTWCQFLGKVPAFARVVALVNTVAPAWAGLEIRRCPALRRTHLTIYGEIDDAVLAELRSAIADALAEGHKLTIDLDSLTAVKRASCDELQQLVTESTQF
jgi:hypothetical protein